MLCKGLSEGWSTALVWFPRCRPVDMRGFVGHREEPEALLVGVEGKCLSGLEKQQPLVFTEILLRVGVNCPGGVDSRAFPAEVWCLSLALRGCLCIKVSLNKVCALEVEK